jgi:hypothetical protein
MSHIVFLFHYVIITVVLINIKRVSRKEFHMNWVTNFFNPLIGGLSSTIQAVLLLILAWIFAAIFRNIVKGVLTKISAKHMPASSGNAEKESRNMTDMLGNLTFAIVFFLFLPGALDKLGMNNVSAPIASMASKFINFLPNIIAACILTAFGVFLAKLACQLLSATLKKTKLDSLQAQCGIEAKPGTGFSDIIARIVYVLILITFVVAAIQVLNIPAISAPATAMIAQIFNFIPRLFAAIILIAFGLFLANLVGKLVKTVLAGTGMDQYAKKTFQNNNEKATPASAITGGIVTAVINILFFVSAIKILEIDVLTGVGNAIIRYLPSLLAACLVLIAAWAAANWAGDSVLKTYPKAEGLSVAAKTGIMVLAGFMAISQLGISKTIIDTLFMWLCIAAAAAFAIAFGTGGRDWAKKKLEEMEKNKEEQTGKK